MSEGQTGKPGHTPSAENLEKLAASHATPEWKAKVRAKLVGRKKTPEQREAAGGANRGRVQTPETIAKRVAAIKATRALKSPEELAVTNAKIAASLKGQVISPETRQKQSEAARARKNPAL